MNLEERIYDAAGKLTDKVEGWFDQMIIMLPNFLIAILVVIFFAVLASISRKLTIKGLMKISRNIAMNKLMATIFSIVVLSIGIFIALGVLNLSKTVTSLLAGVGVVGLALGFAFQDTAANFISGIFMAVQYPMNVGDIVETNDYFGTVEKIGTRYTIIATPQAQKVVLPNKSVIDSALKNYSISGERRIDLGCGISYGDDLEKVKKIVVEAIETINDINKDKPVQFFYTEYGDSSINFVVRYWIAFGRQPDFFEARSEGIMAIKKAFNENDITIPFPIRTLDFGIKGGEKLYEVWPQQNGNDKGNASA